MTNGKRRPKSVSVSSASSRIGLFGGSFNPPHVAHLVIAEWVRREFNLEKVVFVPTFLPPHKETPTPFKLRCRMVRLAIANRRYFAVSDVEKNLTPPSYTIATIRHFRRQLPEARFFLIIGSDQFLEIDTWYKPAALLKECRLIVVPRLGFEISPRRKYFKQALITQLKPIDISSSRIRERSRRGLPILQLVPGPVASFIRKHNLYRRPKPSSCRVRSPNTRRSRPKVKSGSMAIGRR